MSEDMKYFELSSSCGSGSNRNIVPISRKITQSYISYIFSRFGLRFSWQMRSD